MQKVVHLGEVRETVFLSLFKHLVIIWSRVDSGIRSLSVQIV